MKNLSIDIETFSSADLTKCGAYAYAESPDFEILLFGYAVDDGEVCVADLASGARFPADVMAALIDPSVTKWAFNAAFERVCLSRYLCQWLNPASWRCTMVWAATLGLPLSLEGAGTVLGLEKQKLREGKDLIRYFCQPCLPSKVNNNRTRNLPVHAPDKWAAFVAYNRRDVETERAIQQKLAKFPVPAQEWENYVLDQRINDRGIALDMELVRRAMECDQQARDAHLTKARELTGLENPNSTQQLKAWLERNGLTVESLSKSAVADLLMEAEGVPREVLLLRRELAKSSVKKYTAMRNAVCRDGRARGLLQFYGASRTGRAAGRLIQVHNLPQNHMPDLGSARNLVRTGQYGAVEAQYDSVPLVLSELIRTAFVPKQGHRFLVADFSAIEARVIAWLAGEQWRLDVFQTHGKIYEASASQMFHVPIDEITRGSELRQKGKVSELACGYGGSVGALVNMGALAMGVPEAELPGLIQNWRASNPKIVKLWWAVGDAALKAVRERAITETHGIRFSYESGMLFTRLPSGRRLAYVKPRIQKNKFDRDGLTYEGVGENKKWQRIETWGPKCVENIVQATARDLLTDAMRRIDAAGYRIVLHVHDEIVVEAPPEQSLDALCALMAEQPDWAAGLPLRADGFASEYYRKD